VAGRVRSGRGLVLALALATVAGTPAPAAQRRSAPAPAALPDPTRVLALLDRAATAQIAVLRGRELGLSLDAIQDPTANWVSAAFYTGLGRLARVSDRSGGGAFLREVAEHYNYGLRGGGSDHGRLDADNIAVGELYEELHARTGEPGAIAPLRERLDWTLPYLTPEPAPRRLTWWWSDALFMAPPVMARMSAITRAPSYLTAMDVQWRRTHARLWSPEHGLYYRDERFRQRRSANGRPVFWSRGNAWVVGGLARTLDYMPADFAGRAFYLDTLKAMAAALVKLQRPDGYWTGSLLDPNDPPGPESTGTAYFVYGLAWGINHGVLDRATYLPAVLKGWAALERSVQPDGLPGYAQRTGDQPWPAKAGDHALYGTGAFLLAGLEVMRLGEGVAPLPEPARPPAARVAFAAPQAPAGPAPSDPLEARARTRGLAERQAVYDLAFEPARDMPGAPPSGADGAPRADGVVNPRLSLPLTPPPPDARAPRASVRFAPQRYDDLLWENDRTAHRIYGPALEAYEPPSGSGIDAWGKIVPWPFMERQLATGKQHDFHGEGIDFFDAGGSRGAGGVGVWLDNKLWVSRNWASHRILKDGPDAAEFEVRYAPWPVGVGRQAWETRRFSLPLGTNFTRMVSTFGSDKPGPMTVAVGLQKKSVAAGRSMLTADRARGRFAAWTPNDPDKGAMGIAVMVDPAQIVDVREDAENWLILLKVTPGRPFVYYSGAAWSKGRDFHDRAAWDRYVSEQRPDFRP